MLLSDVCLSRTLGPSREQRSPGRSKCGTEIKPTSHMTRTPLSRSKGQGHQAALLSAALMRKAAVAVVSVGTYSAWASTAMLHLLGGTQGAWAPTGRGEGRGHIVSHSLFTYVLIRHRWMFHQCFHSVGWMI